MKKILIALAVLLGVSVIVYANMPNKMLAQGDAASGTTETQMNSNPQTPDINSVVAPEQSSTDSTDTNVTTPKPITPDTTDQGVQQPNNNDNGDDVDSDESDVSHDPDPETENNGTPAAQES